MCAGILPDVLSMVSNNYGAYIPKLVKETNGWEHLSLAVCPFADNGENEDIISERIFGQHKKIKHTPETGYYLKCFAGYVADEKKRLSATSGGIITWLAGKMLTSGKIDAVACVGQSDHSGRLFEYKLIRNITDIYKCSKSRYYPVEFSGVITEIKRTNEKILFIGLPCFIKAVRLAIKNDEVLKDRIFYTIGLFCGHLKSKHYCAYLARHCGVHESNIKEVNFRKKMPGMPANKYAFEVSTINNGKEMRQQTMMEDVYGGSWSNNLFMLDACEYCDDVMAETADIAIGDAWLPEYMKDYRGTSIIVCRNADLLDILQTGTERAEIAQEEISADKVIQSQVSGLRQRREGLKYRLYLSAKKGIWRPHKRVEADRRAGNFTYRLLQLLRIKTKTLSREAFIKQQPFDGIDIFIRLIRPWIVLGKVFNLIRHSPLIIKRKILGTLKKLQRATCQGI